MLKQKLLPSYQMFKNISWVRYIVGPLAVQNYKTDQERVSTVTELNQLQGLGDGLQPKEDVELCD